MRNRTGVRSSVVAAVVVASLAPASQAWAAPTERFASPTGLTSGTCTTAGTACSLPYAANTIAQAGDTVTVLGDQGIYALNASQTVQPPNQVIIRGAPGQPRPEIDTSAGVAFLLQASGSAIRDLRIEHTGASYALALGPETTGERLYVHSVAAAEPCLVTGGAVLRDSVCWNTRQDGFPTALSVEASGGGTVVETLRNVTAVASGPSSSGIFASVDPGTTSTVDAKNVIAAGGLYDLASTSTGTGTTVLSISNSNFNFAKTKAYTANGTINPVPPNQDAASAPPLLRDMAGGDFHEIVGSPTIDAGTAGASALGTTDFEGDARIQNGVPDIGADEIDSVPPDTQITGGPSGTITTNTATFSFTSTKDGSSFQCSLDGSDFAPCSGPGATHALSRLADGAHAFAVRAIDAIGNVDPTPAAQSFTVAVPPQTRITKGEPRKTDKATATFKFSSDEAGSTFECKLDSRRFRPCTSPKTYRHLDDGKHAFSVRATDPAGNVDTTAAHDRWKVTG